MENPKDGQRVGLYSDLFVRFTVWLWSPWKIILSTRKDERIEPCAKWIVYLPP